MDLISRCQAGDEEAFTSLFHAYKNLVYKTAYLMLDNAQEAEDALQEVFIKVHRSLPTFRRSKGAFTTWLHRITMNHCLDRRRKRKATILPLDEQAFRPSTDHTPSPEDRLGQEELLRQALGRLTERQRAVVILRYYWDLSYAETAQVLEIPLGTVRSRLNRAIRALRRELKALESARSPRALPRQETI